MFPARHKFGKRHGHLRVGSLVAMDVFLCDYVAIWIAKGDGKWRGVWEARGGADCSDVLVGCHSLGAVLFGLSETDSSAD